MPTYDYECARCEHEKELNVPIADRDNLYECDICGGALVRVVSFRGLTWAPSSTNGVMR